MLKKKSWDEFRKTGLFLHMNRFLHIFGWVIVLAYDKDDNLVECYPARTSFRGYSEDHESQAFKRTSKYLTENCEDLEKEANQ